MTQININWLKHSCGFGSRTPGRQDRRRRRIHWAMAASKILSFFLALSLSIGHEMRNGVLKVDPKIGHLFLSPLLSVSFFAFGSSLSVSSFFWAFLSFSLLLLGLFIFFFLLLGLFLFDLLSSSFPSGGSTELETFWIESWIQCDHSWRIFAALAKF